MSEPINGRSCGGCTACCKTYRIGPLKKPAGVWCKECAIGVGCRIYESRPEECRGFQCLWLVTDYPESDRPDRLKVVLDFIEESVEGRILPLVRMWEVSPGALNKPRAKQITEILKNGNYVVVHRALQPSGGYRNRVTTSEALTSTREVRILTERLERMVD
jgi:hypothetical protein